jgi:hypothetical protein
MTSEVGLTLDERIRRSLPPLSCPLRIDSFLAVMIKERSRIAASKAQSVRAKSLKDAEKRAPRPERHPGPDAAPAQDTGPQELADSSKLRAEVDAFLHRDDRRDATGDEVSDYLDYMGPTGFNPDELPE